MSGSGLLCPTCRREYPSLATLRIWAWCGECRYRGALYGRCGAFPR